MKSKNYWRLSLFTLLLTICLGLPAMAQEIRYEFQPLPRVNADEELEVHAISDDGTVCGIMFTSDEVRPFLSKGPKLEKIETGIDAGCYAISPSGLPAGAILDPAVGMQQPAIFHDGRTEVLEIPEKVEA